MNNFICEHCNNRMKEHVEDGGKSITFYCDCRKMVPIDEVIEMIDNVLDGHHFTEYGKRFVDLSEEIKQKYRSKDE